MTIEFSRSVNSIVCANLPIRASANISADLVVNPAYYTYSAKNEQKKAIFSETSLDKQVMLHKTRAKLANINGKIAMSEKTTVYDFVYYAIISRRS